MLSFCAIFEMVNSRQRKTLQAIFCDPIPSNIKWSDVGSLLRALGAEIREGKGSRIPVNLNEVHYVFHRPHPENVAGKARIETVRAFLTNAGVGDV
jgi:hypothetical protein